MNLRIAGCDADLLDSVSEALYKLVPEDIDYIGGVALGAVMPATGVLSVSKKYRQTKGLNKLRSLIIRKESKDYGTGGYFVGKVPEKGTRIVLIEDVVTSSTSIMSALEKLWAAELEVSKIVAIVDRSCDGGIKFRDFQEMLKNKNIQFETLFKFQEFMVIHDNFLECIT